MRSILSSLAVWFVLSFVMLGQGTQVNPKTQIRWPAITGSGAPTSPTWLCAASNYGQPYTDITAGKLYVCATAGWVSAGSSAVPAFTTSGSSIPVSGAEAALSVPIGVSSSAAVLRRLTQDDILPGFSINSFVGNSVVEIGVTVANPSFTASYSSTPSSANITNTDGINSPFALTTPFTSATITGSFVHTSAATATFTLTAISSSTRTATQTIQWQFLTFGGVGTPGATGATAGSNTAVLVGATGTLASGGLSNQPVYGPYSPSAQKVYVLMVGGSHTFKDAATGFAFAFNAPTSVSFVNQNGSTVAMFLYESTNTLSGTYSIQVVN